MGLTRHTALIITASTRDIIPACHTARHLGLVVLGPAFAEVNDYATICIPPSGSKLGWEPQVTHQSQMDELKRWMGERNRHACWYEWAEVTYGCDDERATLTDSAWN